MVAICIKFKLDYNFLLENVSKKDLILTIETFNLYFLN